MAQKVFLGMSGGLDSSATLQLLVNEGYDVTGVTFVGLGSEDKKTSGRSQLFMGNISSRKCCSAEEVLVAKQICFSLKVPHITLDLAEVFRIKVREPFVQSYQLGETPNPCMLCNRYVKMGALIDFALQSGADLVAMGHYCGVVQKDGEYLIQAGADSNKDQSYFLALLKPEYLPKLIFPLAQKEKSEIREIIAHSTLPISSNKVESQDVCFIDGDYRDYLKDQGVPENKGKMYYKGKIIGEHRGISFYALGQRRGLGVATGERVFIEKIDTLTNSLYLGNKPQSKEFIVTNLNIFSKYLSDGEWDIQIRYRSPRIKGQITFIDSDTVKVCLHEVQSIVTVGQYAVFYKEGLIYGAGKIASTVLL